MNFAAGYVGSAEDSVRIRRQEKEREKERKKYEAAAAEKHREAQQAGLKQFAATTTEALEHAFKNETVGLVTKADFVKKRTTIQDRIEEELRRKQEEEEQALAEEKERKRQAKMSARTGKLSFAFGEEEADEEDDARPSIKPGSGAAPPAFKLARTAAGSNGQQPQQPAADADEPQPAAANGGSDPHRASSGSPARASGGGGAGATRAGTPPLKKLGKNPAVVTDFLPDRDRARLEAELRSQLKKEWQAQQDKVKAEPLAIVYSYWDGSGHRREIKVKKGDSIGAFLKAVKEQLVTDFRELRHVSVDNLMYIKEDIILPHHHTFYDLIVNKARGKSGPLFDFGVHEDIRLVNDASREKNESHAGKVVERHWYDRNKHIFPASRWEIYDPEKKYDTYTIYGD